MIEKFDIEDIPKGISIQKFKIKPGDYIVVKIDQDKIDMPEAQSILNQYLKIFPKECRILTTFNGIDIVSIIEKEGL